MGRPSKRRQLNVWMNGELVGYWTITTRGHHLFHYAETWLDSGTARPLSLSMPLQAPDAPYKDDIVVSFFENLLPDSLNIRRRIQARFGANSTQAFELLSEIGRDCVGAIQLLPPDMPSIDIHQIVSEPLTEHAIAEILRATVSTPAFDQRVSDDLRISIAGAQEKTAFLRHEGAWHLPHGSTPTTHIFKLPLGLVGNMQADLSTSVENEWLCAQIANAYGLPCAHSEIARFEDQRVLIVERFDRRLSRDGTWWIRLPQEDFCQATGTPVDNKYEKDGGPGIADIMKLLLGSKTAFDDRKRFFKAQVLFWLLAAPDGHAKNFSIFIEPLGRYRLTPLYDILSAHPILGKRANLIAPQKLRMAMAIRGKTRHYHWASIQQRHWLNTAKICGLSEAVATELIQELVEATPGVIEGVSAQLPGSFPEDLAETILRGLKRTAEHLRKYET